MKIVCDNCSTKYSIADEKVRGKVFKIKCKKCSHIIVVKGQEATGEGQPAGFDQKETRVFDYSGFDGKDGGAEPIWHLVIDREQVGPLTVGEVAQKWSTGEIDRETYAWREGFADWQRLGAIDELSNLLTRRSAARAAQPEPRSEAVTDEHQDQPTTADGPAGLFGDASSTPVGGTAALAGGRADPTDLFAGAGTSTEDEAPVDLFGSGGSGQPSVFSSAAPAPTRRSNREDLYGSGEMALSSDAPAADTGPVMTGQRNENSVLFSLNNLSALAGGAEPAPASASRPSGGGPGFTSSFGGSSPEGSGLIDIRAMAAMTLGAAKKEEGPRVSQASDDDLPVFSASAFAAPAGGVLMPTLPPQSNRMMYIFMGVVAVLAVAAIILVAVILLGKKTPPAPATLVPATSVRSPTPTAVPSATAGTAEPASATPPAAPPPSAPPAAAAPAAAPTKAPVATPSRPARTPSRPERRPTHATAPPPAAPSRPEHTAPPPTHHAQPTVKPQKCDEVACLVSPDLPCCPKKTASRPAARADSNLPDRLDQADIIAGMRAVNGRVMACNDRFRVPGRFKVKVTVNANGVVTSTAASAPIAGSPAERCVESAVRGAHFKRTKNSITFNYPYTFR